VTATDLQAQAHPEVHPDGSHSRVMRRLFGRATNGEWIFPVAVLSALYFFDEFDTSAFATLAPEIQRDFGLSDSDFLGLILVNLALLAVLALPFGYWADRTRRTKLVVASGVLAGVFSLVTGLAGTVAVLVLGRFGNGLGSLANTTVHRSLLTDYYTPASRPGVFAAHTNSLYVGAVLGPLLAGGLGALFGWRAAFSVLLIPIVLTSLIALKLPEVRRGATDDAAGARGLEQERAPSFIPSVKILFGVKTLRLQYVGYTLFGVGLVAIAVYLPLFYDRVFEIGPAQRGIFGALGASATFLGVLRGGRKAAGWFAKDPREPLRQAGYALGSYGITLLAIAVTPYLWLSVLLGTVGAFFVGNFFAPFYAAQALVTPPKVRTLSFSMGGIFFVIGFAFFYLTGLATISDNHGIRWGLAVLTPFWVAAGAVTWLSGRYMQEDATKQLAGLLAAREPGDDDGPDGEADDPWGGGNGPVPGGLPDPYEPASSQPHLQPDADGAAHDRPILLSCRGVDAAYGQVQVLFDVNLDILDGEILALLGTNGAGKSTVLRIISGLLGASDGNVWFDGQDITNLPPRKLVELGIVQMPGGRSVFPTLTIAESLRLAGWMYKKSDPEHVKQATEQVLEYFPILRERKDQLAGDLSGGEQQMLGLAMAFIAKPKLLMIDELSLGLAPIIVGQLVDIVRRISAQGTTIVLVEQSVNVALTLAERAIFMEKGEVRFSGRTADLLGRGDLLRSVFLEGAGAKKSEKAVVRERGARTDLTVPPLLKATGLVKRFGGIAATSDVSFQLNKNEILGIIGPNGAGKTTLFDLVSGYLQPDEGSVHFLGQDVSQWSPDQRAFAGLARSFQDARLFPSLTVAENLGLAFERHLEVRDVLAATLGLPAVQQSEVQIAITVHELIELLGLQAFAHKFVSELSTGSRRIVDLGMALAHRPDVLILDEPSSGIAQRETEALGPLLVRIHEELGCSLLVIEHDMPLLLSISDRLLALETGRLIAEGTPEQVIADPLVVASYLDTDESVISRSGTRTVEEPIEEAPPVKAARRRVVRVDPDATDTPRPARSRAGGRS
jgi:branched-chain amino acid transport system ATP-binding protein